MSVRVASMIGSGLHVRVKRYCEVEGISIAQAVDRALLALVGGVDAAWIVPEPARNRHSSDPRDESGADGSCAGTGTESAQIRHGIDPSGGIIGGELELGLSKIEEEQRESLKGVRGERIPGEPPGFSRFWEHENCPRGRGWSTRKKALQRWQGQNLEAVADEVIRAMLLGVASYDWRKENRRFRPYATTFLNDLYWQGLLDDPPSTSEPANGNRGSPVLVQAAAASAADDGLLPDDDDDNEPDDDLPY